MEVLVQRRVSDTRYEYTLKLQIGSICSEIRYNDEEIHQKLEKLYHNYLTEEPADVIMELELSDNLTVEKIESILTRSRYMHQGNHFRSSGKLLKGIYDMESHTVKIAGERNLIDPDNPEINLLNQLIAVAYYTGCRMKYNDNPPAMLFHGCGILRNGRVLVFTGPSDIGKSTIAKLCNNKHGEVLNDEMLLISNQNSNGNGVLVQNTPILGDFLPGRNFTAPLGCVFLLKQNHRTTYNCLDKAEAYLRFIRQVIAPSCVGNYDKKIAYSLMANFSSMIVQSVPVYELEFNLDSDSIWKITDEVNGIAVKETKK